MVFDSDMFVLWNENRFAEILRKKFGKEKVITYEADLNKLSPNVNNLLILAELDWNNQHKSEFYGFKIVRDLRLQNRMLCPISICSFMSKKYFLHNSHKNILFNLFKAPAHNYIPLPYNFDLIHTLSSPSLSVEMLDDIIEHLCDTEGIYNENLHRLENGLRFLDNENDPRTKIVELVNVFFDRIVHLFVDEDALIKTRYRWLETLEERVFSENHFQLAGRIVRALGNDLRVTLMPPVTSSIVIPEKKPLWKVLLIEDKLNIRKNIVDAFAKRNIVCESVCSATEAFELLKSDEKTNRITVVIADYRLEDENEVWHLLQGYSILKEIYLNKPNLVSFFALTAANRRALLRIQKDYQMRVFVYSKDDVLTSDGGFNIFAQKIREEGNKTFEAIHNKPTCSSWLNGHTKFRNPLKDYYRSHRLSLDYEHAEDYISREAENYTENIRHAIGYGTEPASHHFDFQAGLPDHPENTKALEKFRFKLIGRRIALALHIAEGLDRKGIFYALKKDPIVGKVINLNSDETKKLNNQINQLINTHLALSLETDIPDNLLPEERYWLITYMNMDIDKSNLFQEAFIALENILTCIQDELRQQEYYGPFIDKDIRILSKNQAKEEVGMAIRLADKFEIKDSIQSLFIELFQEAEENRFLKLALKYSELYDLCLKIAGFNEKSH